MNAAHVSFSLLYNKRNTSKRKFIHLLSHRNSDINTQNDGVLSVRKRSGSVPKDVTRNSVGGGSEQTKTEQISVAATLGLVLC